MAHAIAYVNGRFSFARAQGTTRAWHESVTMTDDQIILPTDDRATILRKAGLDYQVLQSPLYYRPECDRPDRHGGTRLPARVLADQVLQNRSDNGAPLGIVGASFRTVQPYEAYDVASEWCERGQVKLETMFALHGGRVYGALFSLAEQAMIGDGDAVLPYLYWSTACDGSRATTVKNTAIRVVCANTDAMTSGAKAQFRKSHKSTYSAREARQCVEAALVEFGAYVNMAKALAAVQVDSKRAHELTEALIGPAKTPEGRTRNAYNSILSLFAGEGSGSTLSTAQGTAWGYLNAVTDYVDHVARTTTPDNRFDSAQSGPGAALKAQARDLLLDMVA